MKKVVFIYIFLCFLISKAQTRDTLIYKMNQLIKNVSTESLFFENTLDQNTNITLLFNHQAQDSIFSSELNHLKAKRDYYTSPLSLYLTGRAADNNFFTNNPGEESILQSNLRVGLKYNVLSNGTIANKIHKQNIDKEINNLNIIKNSEQLKNNYGLKYQLIINLFNKLLLKETTVHLQFIEGQLAIAQKLYNIRDIHYTSILNIEKKKKELETLQTQLTEFKYVQNIDRIDFTPSLFHIKIDSLLNQFEYKKQLDNLKSNHYEMVDLKYDKQGLPSLYLFAQHTIAQRQDNNIEQIPSIGFYFSMPILQKSSKTLKKTEKKKIETHLDWQTKNLEKEILIQYYEFQEKSKQIQNFMHQSKIERENITSSMIRKDYEFVTDELYTLQKINTLWDIKYQCIDLLRQQYLIALSMFTKAGLKSKSLKTIIKPYHIHKDNKSTVVYWDLDKSSISSKFLVHFLRRKNIHKIYLHSKDANKRTNMLNTLKNTNLTVIKNLDGYVFINYYNYNEVIKDAKVCIIDIEAWVYELINTL